MTDVLVRELASPACATVTGWTRWPLIGVDSGPVLDRACRLVRDRVDGMACGEVDRVELQPLAVVVDAESRGRLCWSPREKSQLVSLLHRGRLAKVFVIDPAGHLLDPATLLTSVDGATNLTGRPATMTPSICGAYEPMVVSADREPDSGWRFAV